jgi:hypothetical protein
LPATAAIEKLGRTVRHVPEREPGPERVDVRDDPAAAAPAAALPDDRGFARLLDAQPAQAMLRLQRTVGNALAREVVAAALAPARTAAGGTRRLARQRLQLVSGRYVGDLEGAEANVREDVLAVLGQLNRVWAIDNKDYGTEKTNVEAKPSDARLKTADIPLTVAALRKNEDPTIVAPVANALLGLSLTAAVGSGLSNAKADVLALMAALHRNWNIDNGPAGTERAAVEAGPDPVNNADIPETLKGIVRFKSAFVGGTSRRHGALAGTTIADPAKAAQRDAALVTPGTATTTTVVGGVSTVTTAAFNDTVKVAGVDKDYRKDLWDETDKFINGVFPELDAMLKRTKVPLSEFETMAQAAKEKVDGIWGTYGAFGKHFHAGVNLQDASARPGVSADSLMRYLVNNQEELGEVRKRHNADHSRSTEQTIVRDFIRDYIAHGSNRSRLETVDRGWPALNNFRTGIVQIQPYEQATPAKTRRKRWEWFQTLIHEYFHSLNHPNYYRQAATLGADKESVLVEGGASLMTDLTWKKLFPGTIQADAALREAVEGKPAAFDTTVIPPIHEAHYHPQIEQCRKIEQVYGTENFRAAFLTGRMELLGYPMELPVSAAAASGTQTYMVPPVGVSTLADVAFQTQTSVDDLARLNGKPAGATVRPGETLVVRGR